MSEPFSITDIINKNYDESITPIKPTETVKKTYILLIPHDKPDKRVIIHTGLVMSGLPNRTNRLYYLTETLDNDTEIYTKKDVRLEESLKSQILDEISSMMGGGKGKRTKKNKKRKCKKCKSKRRRRS
jgi:hypothetical protein